MTKVLVTPRPVSLVFFQNPKFSWELISIYARVATSSAGLSKK
jgi:hypothetical protein